MLAKVKAMAINILRGGYDMKSVFRKIASSFFFLEFRVLRNMLPTAKDICESIKKYASEKDSEVVFLSEEMPVRFFLDGGVYTTRRGGSVGSPIVVCSLEQ